MTMATMREIARNFDALGSRKKEILATCRIALVGSLDDVLSHLGETGSANGFWSGLLRRIQEENRRAYPLPEQEGVRSAADNYAVGVIERMKESVLFNHSDPAYVAFVREHRRLPKPGDDIYR